MQLGRIRREVGDLWDTRNKGGETKDPEVTGGVACAEGKPTGLVFSPFHCLHLHSPGQACFSLIREGLKRERGEKKCTNPLPHTQGLHFLSHFFFTSLCG